MRILCLSSGLSHTSRSERLAKLCVTYLNASQVDVTFLSLKDQQLGGFDDATVYESAAYRELYEMTAAADGLILASPVYNWGLSAELKKYIEAVGSTPPDRTRRGAFYDKVITFVAAAALPHSYMAVGPLMLSLMMDFKCIINPYTIYIHERHWENDQLIAKADARLKKSMAVMVDLTSLLLPRSYSSEWEI